ncbi:toxin glutamine deamidase domain-containing protein [Kitasatospora sp. McL0602]|uniref:toxin glutamine deamidase domain-containing protein n=1 Tax=Kitasatospora sp. McL0602 TaxID=3439530 RepID=UPI003F8CA6FD
MSRSLPEDLVPVLAKTGHHWPEADEDGLRRAAGLWRDFGAEAERLGRRGGDSAQRVTGENQGRSVDAFADHWRGFSGSGRGHLDDAQAAAELLAKAFDAAAEATDQCKTGIVTALGRLADEMKAGKAAEDKAKTALGGGVLGSIAKAVTTVAVDAGELALLAAAKLHIGHLLEELGDRLEQDLKNALKEPPVTALERLGQGELKINPRAGEVRAAVGGGQLTGPLGAAAGGAVAVAGMRTLHVELRKDGTVVTDSAGAPVLVDQTGRQVIGLAGVTVPVGENGKPMLDPYGNPEVVGKDGQPIVGVALDSAGKPLTDPQGRPVLVGTDGKIGDSGLVLALDGQGNPLTGAGGKPQVLDQLGRPVKPNPDGTYPDGTNPNSKKPDGTYPDGTNPDGTGTLPGGKPKLHIGTDGSLEPTDPTSPLTDPLAPLTGPKAGAGLRTGLPGLGGAQLDLGPTPPTGSGTGIDPTPVVTSSSGGGGGYRHPEPVQHPVDTGGHSGGGYSAGGGGGYGGGSGGGYDGGGSEPSVPLGPVTVHTDSVAVVAPPSAASVPTASSGGDPWGAVGSGDGPSTPSSGGFRADPPVSTGPVGVGGGSVGSVPVSSAPVGAGGGVLPGPVAPSAPPMVPGTPGTPGAPGAPAAPVAGAPAATGGPVAQQAQTAPGAAGAGGASGGSSTTAIGAVGIPAQDARASAAGPRQSAGAAAPGAAPIRSFAEQGDYRRRLDTPGHPAGEWSAPVEPGQVSAAYLVVQSYGRQQPQLPAEPRQSRAQDDGRPYGLPGGLGPVDPAHQREVERRMPRTADGTYLPHPDPRAGDWAEALNGGGHREGGRANNCVDLALSGAGTFAGHPACSAPRLPDGPFGERGGRDRAERELGTRFRDLGDGDGAFEQLVQALRQSGPGSHAVLLTLDEYGRSHTWNAVLHGAAVTYLDHQSGRQAGTPLHPADQGLWAIALDADSRPLDLTELQLAVAAPLPTAEPEPELVEASAAAAPPRSRLTAHRTAGTRSKRR